MAERRADLLQRAPDQLVGLRRLEQTGAGDDEQRLIGTECEGAEG